MFYNLCQSREFRRFYLNEIKKLANKPFCASIVNFSMIDSHRLGFIRKKDLFYLRWNEMPKQFLKRFCFVVWWNKFVLRYFCTAGKNYYAKGQRCINNFVHSPIKLMGSLGCALHKSIPAEPKQIMQIAQIARVKHVSPTAQMNTSSFFGIFSLLRLTYFLTALSSDFHFSNRSVSVYYSLLGTSVPQETTFWC